MTKIPRSSEGPSSSKRMPTIKEGKLQEHSVTIEKGSSLASKVPNETIFNPKSSIDFSAEPISSNHPKAQKTAKWLGREG